MAASNKSTTARGRALDRPKVAGAQHHEVKYESKKTGAAASDV